MIMTYPLVAIDFETHLIDKDNIFPKPVCVSSFTEDGGAFLFKGFHLMEGTIKKFLTENTIIAHNIVFECGVIYYHFPALRELMFTALDEGRIV